MARCAVREPQVPEPSHTALICWTDLGEPLILKKNKRKSKEKRDLPKVTQKDVEKLALRISFPDA